MPTSKAHGPTQPFRLLDLSKELRLMIYERISFTTTQYVLTRPSASLPTSIWPNTRPSSPSSVFFNRRTLSVGILATNQQVRTEATLFLKPLLEKLKTQPIQYLVDYPAAYALATPDSVLHDCLSPGSCPGRQTDIAESNAAVQTFIRRCSMALLSLQQQQQQQEPKHYSKIIITIYSPDGSASLSQVKDALVTLAAHHNTFAAPLEIRFQSPIPDLSSAATYERGIAVRVARHMRIALVARGMRWGSFKAMDERSFKKHLGSVWGVKEVKDRYEDRRPGGVAEVTGG